MSQNNGSGTLKRASGSGLLLAFVAAACSVPSGPPGDTALTIGVQSDDGTATIKSMHITTSIDGVLATDETVSSADAALFPHEVTPPVSDAAKEVTVKIDAFATPNASQNIRIFTRTARVHAVSGAHKLLRIRLDPRCDLAFGVGGTGGPDCTAANQTCISGACADDSLPASALETYASNWPLQQPDICRPANAGAPEVIVGDGQTDYLPLTNGQVLQAEAGPQGGHHIWIAVRMRNLKQAGSVTTITASQPGTGVPVTPTAFVFSFDRDEGGYCKLYGLRFQLDQNGADYTQFLGKPLDVTVTVKDALAQSATGTAHIVIDSHLAGVP